MIEQERITNEYYDAILLDEAHDYLREEIELVRTFTRNLFSVADRRQQIYRRDPQAIDFLRSFSTTINLPFHYRSGVKICRLADEVMKGKDLYSPLEPTSHYREAAKPSSVEYTECDSIERQCELMVNKLQTQLEAYPNELLGVVVLVTKNWRLFDLILCAHHWPGYAYSKTRSTAMPPLMTITQSASRPSTPPKVWNSPPFIFSRARPFARSSRRIET